MNQHSGLKFLIITIILNLIGLGVLAAASFLVYRSSRDTAELATKVVQAEQKRGNIAFLRGVLKDNVAERSQIDAYFVDEGSVVGLVEDLEELGRLSGTKVTVSNVESGTNIRASFRATGSFRNIFHLMKLLESTHYLIAYDRANLQLAGSGWSADFIINILSPQKK